MWKRIKLKASWLYHPVTIFLVVQVLWVVLMVSWIGWYVERYQEAQALAQRVQAQASIEGYGWVPLIVGGILLALILAGSTLIFVFWSKQHRLNQMQRSFVANVTHELKSPVASIQLALETMAMRDLPVEIERECMGMMLADTDRLTQLIDRILGAARIDRKRRHYNFEPVSMTEFVEGVIGTDRHLFEKEGHTVAFEPGRDARVFMDRASMHIVLSNLIENATRYSPPGSPVRLRLQRDLGSCRLEVTDTGAGIERKDYKNVFKMFWRGEHPQPGRARGTGLGLFIVRSIVEDHGGKVWVTSAGPGKGSTFRVRLPRHPRTWRQARRMMREQRRLAATRAKPLPGGVKRAS